MSDNDAEVRLEQAILWRMRLTELRTRSTEEFEVWLADDPRNEAAWSQVQSPWEVLGDHATSPEVIKLRGVALSYADNTGVGWRFRAGEVLRRAAGLGVSAAVAAIAVGAWLFWQSSHFDVYQTRAGEHRMETLSDGSEITLDSNSEVRVRYSRHSRELVLTRGQALFNVAHDVLRPFSVAANRHDIVATGTSFNVDMLGPQLMVTLLEGHVIVMPHEGDKDAVRPDVSRGVSADAAASRIDLDAGEQLVLAPSDIPSITRVNVDHAVAWEKGRLVFEDEPLASVVRRVGRYSSHPIVISDEETARLRISGVFHEGDVEGFVSTVVSYLPVRAEREEDGAVHLSAASAPQDP